jgi:hypothetical protein
MEARKAFAKNERYDLDEEVVPEVAQRQSRQRASVRHHEVPASQPVEFPLKPSLGPSVPASGLGARSMVTPRWLKLLE